MALEMSGGSERIVRSDRAGLFVERYPYFRYSITINRISVTTAARLRRWGSNPLKHAGFSMSNTNA